MSNNEQKPASKILINPPQTMREFAEVSDRIKAAVKWLDGESSRLQQTKLGRTEYAMKVYAVTAELRRSELMVEGFLARVITGLYDEALKADPSAFSVDPDAPKVDLDKVDISLAAGDPDVDPVSGKSEE